jgi:hypothetical protein
MFGNRTQGGYAELSGYDLAATAANDNEVNAWPERTFHMNDNDLSAHDAREVA